MVDYFTLPTGEKIELPPRCSESPDPVHHWFGLTYSAYFVMPRLALQSMPVDWQRRFVALMEECDDLDLVTPEYSVLRRDARGRYCEDPWRDYRRGRAASCDPSWKKMEARR